ncbi:hypothetical protein [Actinoplanes couchii]|uniref:Uncharacterized protein n=1 Tax=Actinoplanes couchii TaxID=403638 RepID=A0ABQ3X018_9ACTN|nr:hypothetical protein [Actinoplanes couchii]MDR6316263.1 hypothetical protein [Actinoplanes couchii]GID51877.1 hypothetical protein Aco03nite_002810 [Actinoplanes couchii]
MTVTENASSDEWAIPGTTDDTFAGSLHRPMKSISERGTQGFTETYSQTSNASTDLPSLQRAAVPKFIRRSGHPRPHGHFTAHESWEGVVEEIYDTYFVAQVVSDSNPHAPECAEIYRSEVSPSDQELLRVGGVFYWSIGYIDSPSGQRIRSSVIRFRRLPSLARVQHDPWIGAVRGVWLKSS